MKTKTTKKGETCTPMEDNPRKKCFHQLMRLKKTDLADLTAGIINLLNNRAFDDGSYYHAGWNDSRRCIIEIMKCNQYWSHE